MLKELIDSIRTGDAQTVLDLLRKGVDVNAYSVKESVYDHEDGQTPLIVAASLGKATIIKCLLEHGANPRQTALQRQSTATPLMYAAGSGNYTSVKLLLAWGAEINATSKQGMNALMWAAGSGNNIVARLLLREGADINAQADTYYFSGQRKGIMTPLIAAVSGGHYMMVSLLLKHGARNTGEQGFTALDIAQSKGYQAIAKLLQSMQ